MFRMPECNLFMSDHVHTLSVDHEPMNVGRLPGNLAGPRPALRLCDLRQPQEDVLEEQP
jgi:hypothetical protein